MTNTLRTATDQATGSARRWATALARDSLGDLRHAARTLRRSPGFTVMVAVLLSFGMGLNVTMFGVVDAFLLRPLPFPDPDRLVFLDEHAPGHPGTMKVALAHFADWQERQRVFIDMAAFQSGRVSLSGSGDAESVDSLLATAALFRVLGVALCLGSASGLGGGARRPIAGVTLTREWQASGNRSNASSHHPTRRLVSGPSSL